VGVPQSLKRAFWWADLAVRKGAMYFQSERDNIARLTEQHGHLNWEMEMETDAGSSCGGGSVVIVPKRIDLVRRVRLVPRGLSSEQVVVRNSYEPPTAKAKAKGSRKEGTDPSTLEPIYLEEMIAADLDKVYHGRKTRECMVICCPAGIEARNVVIRECSGELVSVAVYNADDSILSKLVVGQVVTILEPYYRLTTSGTRNLRVDNPQVDIVFGVKREVCWLCLCSDKRLNLCSKCRVAKYCHVDCQKKDWNQLGHKQECMHLR
jgi:hypothetical protein